MRRTIGSLFSGSGALDLAVARVYGADPIWHVENDPGAQAVLRHHYPDVKLYDDVTTVDWAGIEPPDILTGGFPCQDVSASGRGKGLIRTGDTANRSGLWAYMCDAIDELRPGLVVIENVRGLLHARADSNVEPCPWCVGDEESEPALRALGAVLGDLADVGYDTEWLGVRATDVGAPHERFRVFVVARPTDSDVERLARPEQDTPRRSRSADESPRCRRSSADAEDDRRSSQQSGGPESQRAGATSNPGAPADATGSRRGQGEDGGTGRRDAGSRPRSGEPERDRREPIPDATGDGRDEGRTHWGLYEPAIRRWESVLGRAAPSPVDGRGRLSAAFDEWMMGWPAGWVTDPAIWTGWKPGKARNAQLRLCGNGVVDRQAEAALRACRPQVI